MTRNIVLLLACLVVSVLSAQEKYEPTLESFEKHYEFPEWYRDAKFGIWAHWGPQAVPRMGDWYAKYMYKQGSRQYNYHLEHYGHPSEVGYKDVIPDWKAERWNPEQLMKLYKRVGAKYFVSMGVHHDNFYLWDSKIHKWNSVQMGPKRDVVGEWQKAAKKEGLYFGISEHLGASYTWFQASRGADKTGPKAGVPYDGANPEYEDLYHKKTKEGDTEWYTTNQENHKAWLASISEVLDMYKPDLLYSDGALAFGNYGKEMIAHFYNSNKDAVYTCKSGIATPYWVLDFERGKADSILPFPWQTDSSIGDWFYETGQKYTSAKQIIEMLVDIVSKNGNLLLNVVQTPEGDLDKEMVSILEEIADWIKDNGEGIYGTRPWEIYGEGPFISTQKEDGNHGGFKEIASTPYTDSDFRFTQKGETVYAFCMAKPTGDLLIKSFSENSELINKPINSVKMLGNKSKLKWVQTKEGLLISIPGSLPDYSTTGFEVDF